jgi:hypothetical protein
MEVEARGAKLGHRNAEMNARSNKVHPMAQINLKEIGGLLMHDTVKLPETIDGVCQRIRRDLCVITRGDEESPSFVQ